MANRVVSVNLIANIGSYVSGMNTAAAATMRLGDSATASTKKAQGGFDAAGKGALIMGAAVVGGMGLAISKSMDFEKSMSAVGAATQATSATLGDLREAAMKAGADTQYSATEAADAITEMAKAGVSAKDIMGGGLSGALSLAAAGQMEVADAAGIASVAMTQFSLSGADLPHVADLLAAGAGKAMGSVEDLGAALNQSGLIASAAGLSIEETTGTLAAFANAGLIGSDSGTSFKTMLQALQAPTEKSAGLMAELGINMYDANGNMLGVSEMAGQLQGALGGLTEEQRNSALATIFGSDAVRAANVLYKEGQDGIQGWIDKTNDAGYAQETAAALTDNLAGDLERLGGSFDTLLISLGEGAQGPLRDLVQGLTDLLNAIGGDAEAFASLPAPVRLAFDALDGLFTVVGLVAEAFGALSGPMQIAVIAAAGWAGAGDRIMGVLKPMGSALGPLRGTWSAFGEALGYARANGDGLTTVLKSVGETAGGAALSGVKALGRAIGPELAVGAAVIVISQLVEGFQALTSASDSAKAASEGLARSLTLTNDALDRESVRGAIEDTEGLVEILDRAGVSSSDAMDGLLGQASAQDRVTGALQTYMGTLNPRLGEVTAEDVRQAVMAYEELAGGYGSAAGNARFFADSAAGSTAAAQATGAAAEESVPKIDAATQAVQKWREQLQQVGSSFVEPLAIYKGLLQEAAQATADATESSEDSWSDYAANASVDLDTFAQKLQDQITAQENWRRNLVTISQRGGAEVAQILADMGVEGAGYVQQMVDANGEQFGVMKDLMIRDARLGGSGAAAALDNEMKVMAAYSAAGGKATVGALAKQLGLGVGEVARIVEQYGGQLIYGINPILGALGKNSIALVKRGGASSYEQAGRGGYAEGGFTGYGGKYEYAGPAHKGEVIWSQEDVAAHGGPARVEKMRRARGYANGGFASLDDVPRPSSTAPYRAPISTAGDAAMGKVYGDTVDWLKANLAPQLGPGVGWSAMWDAVHRQFPWAQLTSSFRPGAITATGNRSYHSMGRAIDVSPSMEIFDWIAKNYAATELIYSPAGGRQEWRGQPHMYGEPTRGDHWDHVHWAMANGGIIGEPVIGRGLRTGASYSFGERGPETVTPGIRSREFSGGGGRGGGGLAGSGDTVVHVYIDGQEFRGIARVEAAGVVASRGAASARAIASRPR